MNMRVVIRYAAGSDIGCARGNNEDSAYAGPWLLAVADGMGGHAGGEVASSLVIESLSSVDAEVPVAELVGTLEQAVMRANETITRKVHEDPRLATMGTTLTALLWSGSQFALGHIGDSRAYLLRDGGLAQLTEDHTLEQMLAAETGGSARHGTRLMRVLDGRPDRLPDLTLREAKPGDRYLLCSDGLTGPVDVEAIHRVLTTVPAADEAVTTLIELAKQAGGPDNVTVIVADVTESGAERHPAVLVGAVES
jgi:PPM family protein phosphatase